MAPSRDEILEALALCEGNRSRAARTLGIPRRTFYNHLRMFEIDPSSIGGSGVRMPLAEISRRLNIPIKDVLEIEQRALKKMRSELKRLGRIEW